MIVRRQWARGVLAWALLLCLYPNVASAQMVLTFEGQAQGYVSSLDGSGYGGFTWANFNALNNSPYLNGYQGGYISGAVSGTTVAYNTTDGTATPATISRETPFTFTSGYLTAAYNDNLSVTVEGLRAGSLLYSTQLTVGPQTATLHTFDYVGIDEIRFYSSGGTRSSSVTYGGYGDNVVLDNLSFAAVPEPSSGLLLCACVPGLIWASRRCRGRQIVVSVDAEPAVAADPAA